MNEVHGLRGLTKIQYGPEPSRTLTVEDAPPSVMLRVAGETYPTGMTPDEAEWLAKQRVASAKRVRASGD